MILAMFIVLSDNKKACVCHNNKLSEISTMNQVLTTVKMFVTGYTPNIKIRDR